MLVLYMLITYFVDIIYICVPQRLHKYANYNGKPIFAQYDADAAQVLAAAAAETHW